LMSISIALEAGPATSLMREIHGIRKRI